MSEEKDTIKQDIKIGKLLLIEGHKKLTKVIENIDSYMNNKEFYEATECILLSWSPICQLFEKQEDPIGNELSNLLGTVQEIIYDKVEAIIEAIDQEKSK